MTDNFPELDDKLNNFFMPGAKLFDFDSLFDLEVKYNLGFGLEIDENYSKEGIKISILVSHSGMLKFSPPNNIYIESMSKVYIPYEGDRIVGKVIKKFGDYYQIDFGGSSYANLNYLHFQEATKNNRPNVKIGDIIYCQITLAGRGIEPEVTCINTLGKSVGMGVVGHSEDLLIKVDLPTSRKLLNVDSFPMLKKIGLVIS